jgi:S1-C subfamily serine protease
LQAALWRDGNMKTVTIKTKVFPLELAEDLAFKLLGINVDDLTPKNRQAYAISASEGVVIAKIKKKSYLARIGALPGDVIHQIDDYAIQDKEDFKKAVVKFRRKNSVVLLLQRGDQGYYITINIG